MSHIIAFHDFTYSQVEAEAARDQMAATLEILKAEQVGRGHSFLSLRDTLHKGLGILPEALYFIIIDSGCNALLKSVRIQVIPVVHRSLFS